MPDSGPAGRSLWNDEPTLEDELGRIPLVRDVARHVATCRPPQVFGLHGGWGSGKTSLLHQVHWHLTGECPQQAEAKDDKGKRRIKERLKGRGLATGEYRENVAVVWFEAWRYQHEAVPIVALLHEIRSQLPWTARFKNNVKKLSEVTVRGALLSIEDLTKKIGFQASKVQEAGERWEKDHLAGSLPSHVIRQHLEEALDQLLRNPKGEPEGKAPSNRLVILVDDLDRCEPRAAYQLLEGIKIYLNLRNCVFLLGMHHGVIEEAIAHQLPRDGRDEKGVLRARRAREYLEKLCHNIFHLQPIDDPGPLLRHYLEGSRDALSFPAVDDVVSVVQAFAVLPGNARRIKSFSNVLLRNAERVGPLITEQENPEGRRRKARLVVLLASLYVFHPEIYRHLRARSDFFGVLRGWITGDPHFETHDALRHIDRVQRYEKDESDPTPTPSPGAYLFPDPSEPNVLRVQSLIMQLRPPERTELDEIQLV